MTVNVATVITIEELKGLSSFDAAETRVRRALDESIGDARAFVRFFGRYTSWNGFFGSAVATLAGKIGRCRGLFLDPAQPIKQLADRSVYIASFFFDAARDEFDDRDTVHRDTHRCLAQSTVKGLIDWHAARGAAPFEDPAALNALLQEPLWLNTLNTQVAHGYGAGTPDDVPSVFRSIGYHLGSELLADQEFSLIDQTMRERAPDLTEFLRGHKVNIAGQDHVAYQWVSIHSGHGGGAEADHFKWATRGARLAFRFVAPELHDELRREIHKGFRRFAADHEEFFTRVNQS